MASADQPSGRRPRHCRRQALAQHPQQREIAGAAAGDDPAPWLLRQQRHDPGDGLDRERRERCGAIRGRIGRQRQRCKIVAIERLRRRQRKERICIARITQPTSTTPWAAVRPSQSNGWPTAEHVIVEQRVARAGVAGDQGVGAIDIGDVGNAADIDHDHRPFPIQGLGQRAVIDRYEWRALPAGGDVGRAEIMHDRDMYRLGERAGVADLHGHSLRGPMQHRLAVEADNIDVLARDTVQRGKRGNSLGMSDGDGALRLAQDSRVERRDATNWPPRPVPGAEGPALSL